jgi:hypothetical protein
LVIVTRRDYGSHDIVDSPGSTPHTEDELEDIKAGRGIFLQRLGLEVANFLLWFAETHKVPMISDDKKSGGISVMGWSLGAVSPLALLGHPDVIPKESKQQLALYLRQALLYSAFVFYFQPLTCNQRPLDPAEVSFGYHFDREDGKYPASLSDFPMLVSAYYTHGDLTSRTGAGATTIDLSKTPSFKNMTNEDLAVNFDMDASMKGDIPMCSCMLPAFGKQTQAAFFDEKLAKEFLPALLIVWLGCSHSPWELEWSKVVIRREFEEHVKQKHEVRLIRFMEIKGANHFVSDFSLHAL